MQRKSKAAIMSFAFVLLLVPVACARSQPIPTDPPEPTSTVTLPPTATQTPRPSPTPRPTQTPDLSATQQVEEWTAEVQAYHEKGYLTTTRGGFIEVADFSYELANLGSYEFLRLPVSASDFFLSAHFKWNSALESAGTAGCGFIFGRQSNRDHYAVFLDRMKVEFRIRNPALGYSTNVEPSHVTGNVKFDYPAEADFTLIVKDAYAYVLVNGEVIGEYTLPRGRPLRGELGLAVLSGTNRDYGTRCEMTDLHLWIPEE